MDEERRKRGRPKNANAKRKRINLLVSDEFFDELNALSEMEGMSRTDYIIESVRTRGALTRITHEEQEDYYDDYSEYEGENDEEFDE